MDSELNTSYPKRQFSIAYLHLFKVFLYNFKDNSNKCATDLSDTINQIIQKQSLTRYMCVSENKILKLWSDFDECFKDQDLFSSESSQSLNLPKGTYRLIEFLLYSAKDLNSGLEELRKAYPLINPLNKLSYVVNPGDEEATIYIRPWSNDSNRSSTLAMDFEAYWLSCIFKRFHCQSKEVIVKKRWDDSTLTVSIQSNQTQITPPENDPQLFELLKNQASQNYEEILGVPLESISGKTGKKVAGIIQSHPIRKTGSLDFVAEKLAMSSRSLQRRLGDEKLNFSSLVSFIKMEMAKQILIDTEKTASYISETLGFSEPSAFNRAFKQKFGVNPMAFRSNWKVPFHTPSDKSPGYPHNP